MVDEQGEGATVRSAGWFLPHRLVTPWPAVSPPADDSGFVVSPVPSGCGIGGGGGRPVPLRSAVDLPLLTFWQKLRMVGGC